MGLSPVETTGPTCGRPCCRLDCRPRDGCQIEGMHVLIALILAHFRQWFGRLIVDHPDFAPLFAPNGRVLETGELVRCTNLSRTLSTIANEGVDAFYKVVSHSWHHNIPH